MTAIRVEQADSLSAAFDLLSGSGDETRIMSGGTVIILLLKQRLSEVDRIVDISRVCDDRFRAAARRADTLRVGAGLTFTELSESAAVLMHAPTLADAVARVANLRVRNVATIGGNIAEADYASDAPTVLSSLDATYLIESASSSRTVKAVDFATGPLQTVLAPGEILTRIDIPVLKENEYADYVRFSSRSYADRPCVVVGTKIRVNNMSEVEYVNISVGAASSKPYVDHASLSEMAGVRVDEIDIARFCTDYASGVPFISDGRGSAQYRLKVTTELIRRSITRVFAQVLESCASCERSVDW